MHPSFSRRTAWVILLGIGILVALYFLFTCPCTARVEKNGEAGSDISAITFSEEGYMTDREPEQFGSGLYLVYEKPGAPALSVPLVFDEKSFCTFGGRRIVCMALSVTIDTATEGRRVFVEGVKMGEVVVVRELVVQDEKTSRFGLVRGVRRVGQDVVIDVDEVEFLSGEEAIQAGISDTQCTRETISDCVPSLNNDFYIRNVDRQTRPYLLTSETAIILFTHPGGPDLHQATLDDFVAQAGEPQTHIFAYPFQFIAEGERIVILEEQYLP